MEPLPRGPGRAAWPLTCLVLLSLYGWPGKPCSPGLAFYFFSPCFVFLLLLFYFVFLPFLLRPPLCCPSAARLPYAT